MKFIMLANVFKDVDYPTDNKSIEHIICEYDKVIKRLTRERRTNAYVILITLIIIMAAFIVMNFIDLWLTIFYIMPACLCAIYEVFVISSKCKNQNDEKTNLKKEISKMMVIANFLYISTFMLQIIIWGDKWDKQMYFICLGVFFILAAVTYAVTRIKAPKKFIRDYQYSRKKEYKSAPIMIAIALLFSYIIRVHRPVGLILAGGYIIIMLLIFLITYFCFFYSQYDRIQELKKQINYRDKN